jgi:outer membrane receptor protein involved in Fe transport
MTNANVGVEHLAWRAVLYVDNVFNERGVTTAFPAAAVGQRDAVQWLSRPLTVGLRVAYKIPN